MRESSDESLISIKNVILPNKPLNNFELEEATKKLKILCFRGVFLLDTLVSKDNMADISKKPAYASPKRLFQLFQFPQLP